MRRRVVAGALLLVALTGCSRPYDHQLRRVNLDGQECVVVERRFGRIEAVDCDWSNR